MKEKYTHTLLALVLGGIIALLVVAYFRTDSTPQYVYTTTPVKTIEKRIVDKDTIINRYTTQVINEKAIVQAISNQIDSIRAELAEVKAQKDTFQIVQIQDTLINTLTLENHRLYGIIEAQDSIIVAQRYIINSKDTLIAIARHDGKKYKKQRNIAIAGNAVQGIIIGGLLLTR